MNVPMNYDIQLCDTHPLFVRHDTGQISAEPGKLIDSEIEPDPEAVLSVLQFGAVIPPLSPWSGIKRLLPGYRYCGTESVARLDKEKTPEICNFSPEQQADEVERIMDRVLIRRLGRDSSPVLLFSGGVDSGFIASRLSALGYGDTLLVNYSFGPDDPESDLAEKMARHLGLKCKRIQAGSMQCRCLEEPGSIYVQPFGDPSTVPTSELGHAVAELLGGGHRIIIDGTGADGGFGLSIKIRIWERLVLIPAFLRRSTVLFYNSLLWKRTGRIEHAFRVVHRSVNMPFLSAVVAQNPLAGLFYSDIARHRLDELFASWIIDQAGDQPATLAVAGDLALVCANIFAQKALPILESAGHKVVYPFLDPEMVALALNAVQFWQMKEAKEPLKTSLERRVPRKMVRRPKSGFMDPERGIFFDEQFIGYLRSAVEETGPISGLLKKEPLLKACLLLRRKKKMPAQTLWLLWTVVFTDRWYRTAFA